VSTSFADLGVPAHIVSNLHAAGIDEPFPIQAVTIPDALAGRDLCGRAPTGSGKTIAFGIPMVVLTGKAKPRRPRGLVLVPTRELASQVASELELLAKPKGPWVQAFYGGVGFDKQIKALQKGCDIVVACPGRLADLINQRYLSLDDVDFVVIDEADRMADMGFLPEVKRLLDQCSEKRQTLLFSATLDGDVDVLIKRYQHNPARHEFIAEDEGGVLADHYFWQVDRLDRLKAAAATIKRLGPTVVFCRTKRGADRIATQLEAAGVRSAAIHGDRSQSQRERALESFHKGRVQALVATDVAARGIHVDGVLGVIHYDPPGDHKDYVHRSGRTARAGNKGTVVSLVAPELRKDVAAIQKALGYPIGLSPLDLDVLDVATAPSVKASSPSRTTASSPAVAAPAARPSSAAPSTAARETRERAPRRDADSRPSPSRTFESRTPRRSDATDTARPTVRSTERERPAASATPATPRVERIGDLAPLDDGQRRPSGAARRKAKRLAQAELARMYPDGVPPEHDLRDGRSSRPAPSPRRSDGPRKSSGPKRSSASNGARSASRAGAPSRSGSSSAGGRSTSGPGRSSKPASGGRSAAPSRSGPSTRTRRSS
jgi:superfamily II DNA/RNA helicase